MPSHHIAAQPDGTLAATGTRYKLAVTYDNARRVWRATIRQIADPDNATDWAATSPDLVHLLTTAQAQLTLLHPVPQRQP